MLTKLELLGTGEEYKVYAFEKDLITIGRSPENDIVIDSSQVSKFHCRLIVKSGVMEVEDLNSTNGTRINGQRLERTQLSTGDQITLSFSVPPIKVTLEPVLDLRDLGFDAPGAQPPEILDHPAATIVGQATLDEAMRAQIARNAAQRSVPRKASEPPAPVQPRVTSVTSKTKNELPTPKPTNNNQIWILVGAALILILVILLVLQ